MGKVGLDEGVVGGCSRRVSMDRDYRAVLENGRARVKVSCS